MSITTPPVSKEQPMKKSSFVPKPDQLEGRIALSSMPKFSHGAAILTRHALGETYSQIQKAFTQYTNHGHNFNRLESNLASAVGRIPYNHRDGLLASVESEATQMQVDIASIAVKPVGSALQRALNDVNDFVQGEMSSGTIVLR
jgi:hypothetical protein